MVLCGVDLEVHEGERLAIVGPSGAGKSILMRCINGLEAVDSGRISIGGVSVFGRSPEARGARARTGMVFQGFNLFPHLTILENCVLAPIHVRGQQASEAASRTRSLLARVGIEDQVAKLPSELSGGQQQRAAIARALAMEPDIMLLDEPTSALDPEAVGDVLDVIADLAAGGMTMLLATHEMAFARKVADRVVFMDKGAVLEVGRPEAFFAKPQTERAQAFLGRVLRH